MPPFYGNSDEEIINMVKKGFFTFDLEELISVDERAMDLIKKMITKPNDRLTATEVLNHP